MTIKKRKKSALDKILLVAFIIICVGVIGLAIWYNIIKANAEADPTYFEKSWRIVEKQFIAVWEIIQSWIVTLATPLGLWKIFSASRGIKNYIIEVTTETKEDQQQMTLSKKRAIKKALAKKQEITTKVQISKKQKTLNVVIDYFKNLGISVNSEEALQIYKLLEKKDFAGAKSLIYNICYQHLTIDVFVKLYQSLNA